MKVVHSKNIGLKGQLVVYLDGACSYNNTVDQSKRRMSIGIYDANADYFQYNMALKKGGSNNIAELLAVYEALEYARIQCVKEVKLITDSANNVAWLKKNKVGKKVNDPKLTNQILERINKLIPLFTKVEVEQVPRSQNIAGIRLEKYLKEHKIEI